MLHHCTAKFQLATAGVFEQRTKPVTAAELLVACGLQHATRASIDQTEGRGSRAAGPRAVPGPRSAAKKQARLTSPAGSDVSKGWVQTTARGGFRRETGVGFIIIIIYSSFHRVSCDHLQVSPCSSITLRLMRERISAPGPQIAQVTARRADFSIKANRS